MKLLNDTKQRRPSSRTASKWDLVKRQQETQISQGSPVTICPHNASPVYGCRSCGILPFSLPPNQRYNLWVPSSDGNLPVDKPSFFSHWWGVNVNFPEPTLDKLQTGSSFFLASITFAGGLASLAVPGVGIAFGTVASWMVLQNSWIRLVDRGYGVKLTSFWLFPVIAVPTALPPPVVESTPLDIKQSKYLRKLLRVKPEDQKISWRHIILHPVVLVAGSSLFTVCIMKFVTK